MVDQAEKVLKGLLDIPEDAPFEDVVSKLHDEYGGLLDEAQEADLVQDERDIASIIVMSSVCMAGIMQTVIETDDVDIGEILTVVSDQIEMAYMLGKSRSEEKDGK